MINLHEKFYNLSADPFRLSSDYLFSFAHKSYTNAIGYLKFALHSEEGFIVITGKPGTGKTTLINEVVSQLDPREVEVATLVTTAYEAEDLLHMIASAFDLKPDASKKSNVLLEIERFLRKKHAEGKRVLLIVDEAQGLKRDAVEELRLLSNLQIDGKPLLQTFLIGQEEFRSVIELPEFEQLRQRVIASSHLEALSETETFEYVTHRLEHAGWKGDPSITKGVVLLVHHFSGGVPRIINLICGRLLFHGCMEEKHALNVEDMKSVLNELSEELLVIDSAHDLSEIADRLVAAEQEYIEPSLPHKEPLEVENEHARLGEEVESAQLNSSCTDRVEGVAEEALYVLHGNALKKASDPEWGATQNNVTEMKFPEEQTVLREVDSSPVSNGSDDEQPLAPQNDDTGSHEGDRHEAHRENSGKAGGRSSWLAVAISGSLVAVLLVLFYLYQQDAIVDQVSKVETKTLEKPPVAVEQNDVEKLPASNTLERRIQKQSKAISIIKGIDFSAYESQKARPAQYSGSGRNSKFIGQVESEIASAKSGSVLSNNKARQAGKPASSGNALSERVFQPGVATSPAGRRTSGAGMSRASTVAASDKRLPAIPPTALPAGRKNGLVANATVVTAGSTASEGTVTQAGNMLASASGLQGVDGFGPDKQRQYLFEGKWVGEKSKADFLPSDKVFCKDFYKYVSCWSVPEYTKSSTGEYKQVVESTLSGFTGKGAFTVTSRIKKISVDNQQIPKGNLPAGNVADTIITRSKRCVFIDHNYITCGAEQGGIEKYTRTSL